ncbi:DUF502 domain-containing protein [Algoriphagus boritolerans]|uniref:Uncharacterized membrane protein n=2 Tax=Algoriphagus TaxID=246875 RepID=A0A1H5RN98_9BACT|nr:DUF502 domain-containing protein [Algoriphagus boritolerans]SEF39819.1 Uncharacterized membrane protein [Algoriphagus boritolerans DSM 17298 = JCM 18970]
MKKSPPLPTDRQIPLSKFWSKAFFIETLLNGLILVLPMIIILFLLSLIFKFVFNLVSPISSLLDKNADEHNFLINILALLILIVLIFMIGLAIRSARSFKTFKSFEDRYLLRIPLYSTLQETIAQFTGLKKMPFSQVVLVDAYNTGVLLTGFITEKACDGIYTVFVPTAPNPMNGNIYHVPVRQIRFLDIESEKAMRTIMGLGTGSSVLFSARVKTEEVEELDEVKKFPIANDTNPEVE